ncbi:hypothetical protein [Streptomyces niger]|uniref:hypothetical protein n=1 Tax=Streptomyces niger TaxID=66373 RepID=UPI000AB99CFA|nr:hypothetical protein [Streptomyces niger]
MKELLRAEAGPRAHRPAAPARPAGVAAQDRRYRKRFGGAIAVHAPAARTAGAGRSDDV